MIRKRLAVVISASLLATLGSAQLQAWTRALGTGGNISTCVGIVSTPDGSVSVGRQSVGDSTLFIRRYASDGTQLLDNSIPNIRGLDLITDGSSNTIFVGERSNDNLMVGRITTNGSVAYLTEVAFGSGANLTSARLLYYPANNWIMITTEVGGITQIVRVDNTTGAVTAQTGFATLPSTYAPYMALTGDGKIALACDSSDSIKVAKYDPTTMLGVWNTSFGTNGARVRGVTSSADGTVYALATAQTTYPDYDFLAMRVSPSGSTQWMKLYNGPSDGDDYANSIALDADGNLVLGGSVYDGGIYRAAAMRINATTGDRLWSYVGGRVTDPSLDGDRSDPRAIADGTSNTILVSEILRGGNRLDTGFYKIAPTGVGQWFTWYGSVSNENDTVDGFAWGTNGSFYVAGRIQSIDSSTILLQKYQQPVFSVGPTTVIGGSSATATLSFPEPARVEGYSLAATDDSTALTTPATLSVAGGASTGSIEVQTTPVPSHTAGNITLTFGNTTFTTRLSVAAPTPATVTVTPSSIIGGSNGNVNVTLSGPAPSGGIVVALGRSNPIANVPSALYIPSSGTAGTMLFSTGGVTMDTPVTVSASLNNVVKTAAVTILRGKLVAVNTVGSSMVGGAPIQGTVYLDGKAAGAGAVVSLSDDSSFVTMPSSVTIPAGYKTATYTAATSAVTSNQTVTISAVLNGITKTTTFTLSLPIHSLLISPDVIVKNSTSSGMVMLSQPAPAGGATITLVSGAPALVGVPAAVFIPAGGTSRSFTITTGNVASPTLVGVFATYNSSTKRKDVVVVP